MKYCVLCVLVGVVGVGEMEVIVLVGCIGEIIGCKMNLFVKLMIKVMSMMMMILFCDMVMNFRN